MYKLIVLCLGFVFFGCSFGQWGRDFGGNLVEGASEKADTLGRRIVHGAMESLTGAESRERLNSLIDSLGVTLAQQAAATRDTLVGQYTAEWIATLKSDLLGDETRNQLASMRNEILGEKTRLLLAGLRTELLGDSTRRQAGLLRDELLGPESQIAFRTIVDSAMTSLVRRYRQDLKPELEGQLSFIQRNAMWLLILIAALAIGIIAFVWWQKRKYAKMLQVLTYQIHEIPDQQSYDELTKRIRSQAKSTGVEGDLRKILANNGMLGPGSWVPQKL